MLGRFHTAFGTCAAFRTGAAALLAALLVPGSASAQPLVERFDPSERGSRFFAADSLELDGDLRVTTGVVLAYGSRLRTFRQSDARAGAGREDSRLIENSFWIHPGASLVLAPGARFGLDIPVGLQTGTGATLDGTFYPEPSSPALGDIRGSFDLRLWDPHPRRERTDFDRPVVAVGVTAYIPTGASTAYASDDFARFAFRLATAWQAGPLLLAARVGYMYRKDDLAFAGVRLGGEGTGVLAAGYHRGALVIGPELYGSTVLKTAFDRRSTPLEVLAGAHLRFGDVQVGAGLGTAVVTGLGAPGFRGVLSFDWTPTSGIAIERDRDRDGVPDDDDLCPDVPGLPDAPLGSRGCPGPPLGEPSLPEPAPPAEPAPPL
jgi:OOP family OmpA-OmpF porin